MTLTHLLIISIIQGVTEFLPVSSAGHLALLHSLTPLPDQGILLDVAVHFGTLSAVIIYLWKDVIRAIKGGLALITGKQCDERTLALQLIIATIPVLLAGGLLMALGLTAYLRQPLVIAWAIIFFSIPLYLADRFMENNKTVGETGLWGALLIGLAQITALIPGASRAGVTITAARALKIRRIEAARFSMLMSIPVIIAFTIFILIDLLMNRQVTMLADMGLAIILSALAALLSIHVFLRMTEIFSFLPFVLYRLALGGGLIYLFS
ncbi:MAG: undecaprenyl-diphosphate phosphatase [Alphaproteobacteria bacterium]|nr:undecaprenyl-diphosphate phosphatase [Alphaproteobacteria bacterium]